MHDAHASRESADGVDVQSLLGYHLRGGLYLPGGERAAYEGQDKPVLALSVHPVLVFLVRNGCKADVHTQLRSLEQQFLHDLSRGLVADAYQDAERQRRVDVGLSDIEYAGILAGQYFHH